MRVRRLKSERPGFSGRFRQALLGSIGCRSFLAPRRAVTQRAILIHCLRAYWPDGELDRSESSVRFDVLVKTVEALKWET